MSAPRFVDLAHATEWHGFHPGMTRAEVLEGVQELGASAEWDGDSRMRILVEENEVQFFFAEDGTDRLRQISTDNEDLRWDGKPFMGKPLGEALRAVQPPGALLWQIGRGIEQFSQEPQPLPAVPVSDEQLIEDGTLWLPEHGLALQLSEGRIFEIAWRAPQDLPRQFLGPLTQAQRELSLRPDLEDYLHEKRVERNRANRPKPEPSSLGTLRKLLTLAALAAVAATAWIGVKDMQMWAAAPVLSGKLLGMESGALKPFLEYLPTAVSRWTPDPIRSLVGHPRADHALPGGVRGSGRRAARGQP
jgi:hypothetical protein